MAPDDTSEIVALDDLAVRPGTYFNPQTEVVIVVDDSSSMDQEVFNLDDFEGTDWVRISEEIPLDEHALEQAVETFQTSYHPVARAAVSATRPDHGDDEILEDEEVDDLEPDPEPED
ncbi:hypothetical protein BH24ACT23_BH24ACT23_07920 [soil metagenome]